MDWVLIQILSISCTYRWGPEKVTAFWEDVCIVESGQKRQSPGAAYKAMSPFFTTPCLLPVCHVTSSLPPRALPHLLLIGASWLRTETSTHWGKINFFSSQLWVSSIMSREQGKWLRNTKERKSCITLWSGNFIFNISANCFGKHTLVSTSECVWVGQQVWS